MRIVTLGDVMLDVLVDVPEGLMIDDDTDARITLSAGGQAANVATWVADLGGEAILIGPRCPVGGSTLVAERLARAGVAFAGIPAATSGTVVSILTGTTRTMASDAGDQSWLASVASVATAELPEVFDWLYLSSYPLLRSTIDGGVVSLGSLVVRARSRGALVCIDLSSATMMRAHGVGAFREELGRLQPDLVFANDDEWNTLGVSFGEWPGDVVVKHGARGATVFTNGVATDHAAHPVEVVDTTGAGDAFAAGYLTGGVVLAMGTAARCVAQLGAQPRGSGWLAD